MWICFCYVIQQLSLIIPPASTKLKGDILLSPYPFVCPSALLSARGQNRVRWKHLHHSEITGSVLCGLIPNLLQHCFCKFPILVRRLFKCLTACQLIKKKSLCYSQDNGLTLPKLVWHKISIRDLFPRWSQAAIFVFKCSEGVFVRFVSSTKLAGSISYLHVLSTNFRRWVVFWVSWIICIFSNLSEFVTLALSCVHSIWMFKCFFLSQPHGDTSR